MQKTNLTSALVAGGLALATVNLQAQEAPTPPSPAQHPQDAALSEMARSAATPSCQAASRIIGMRVVSQAGDRLGTVQDLILSLDSGRAPFAIVRYGGTLGIIGGTRVAVPLNELKLSMDNTELTMTATHDQLASASPTPDGAWARVADQDWAKKIDRFYGQPAGMGVAQFERQSVEPAKQGHEFVRHPEEQKGANDSINKVPDSTLLPTAPAAKPADSEITSQVSKLVEQSLGASARNQIQATVEKGVVTLKGKVANAEEQRTLNDKIKALPGVDRVDDQLTVSTKEN